MTKKIKQQIPGHDVTPKHTGSGTGRNGDPMRRAIEIAKRRPELPPRKLAKTAGIPIADAKRIIAQCRGGESYGGEC
jgi:hypothetical protein